MLNKFLKKYNSSIKNILVNYIFTKEFYNLSNKHIQGGKLADIGCGTKPYKDFFSSKVSEHIGIDHSICIHNKNNIDVVGSAYEIPFENEYFDSSISTAVLEHLEEPEKAIRENYRVLKKGSITIYSVPFIWHLHEEPRDFYRYSKFGLEYLFKKCGFEVLEIRALSGFWVTFGQLFVYNMYRRNSGIIRRLHVIDTIGLLIQFTAYLLDKIDKSEQWTWMNIIVARKI